ncbi:SseB family protein [Rhodopseudomonas sp. BR0M22]|uniref:SseB family protein n=2 Tax=unclassified Rhodopseudomonas TaxID=2638247 RepID=UPI0013DFD230|nr:SseB family protein [Rhodopseudomonas sp. BR0M22]
MFEPQNNLEALMQAAARDPDAAPAFYQALLNTEIYILVPEAPVAPGESRALQPQETINVATVEFQGLRWHPAFTSQLRISEYVREPESCLGAVAADLFAMLPGSNFWLNPSSECQKPLPAPEIEMITGGKIFAAVGATSGRRHSPSPTQGHASGKTPIVPPGRIIPKSSGHRE